MANKILLKRTNLDRWSSSAINNLNLNQGELFWYATDNTIVTPANDYIKVKDIISNKYDYNTFSKFLSDNGLAARAGSTSNSGFKFRIINSTQRTCAIADYAEPDSYKFKATGASIVIPAKILLKESESSNACWYTVTKIDSQAFTKDNASAIETVEIPDTVLEIESSAFWNLPLLTTLIIHGNIHLKSIAPSAFYECGNISTIIMPDTTQNTWLSGDRNGTCEGLMSYGLNKTLIFKDNTTIPNTLTVSDNIAAYALCSVRDLQEITVTAQTKNIKIDARACNSCPDLTKITLVNTDSYKISNINQYAFSRTEKLNEVHLHGNFSTTKIASGAFNLEDNTVKIYAPQMTLAQWANGSKDNSWEGLMDCSSEFLSSSVSRELYLGEDNTKVEGNINIDNSCIARDAFQGVRAITGVTLTNTSNIYGGAFNTCTGLVSVSLPSSLTKLCGFAFAHCTSLSTNEDAPSVTYAGTKANFKDILYDTNGKKQDDWESHFPTNTKIMCTDGIYDYVNGCVAPGTLFTKADGTKIAVEKLKPGDLLLSYDFETGKHFAAPIILIDSDPTDLYNVCELVFSNGTKTKIIANHGYFDKTTNKFEYINPFNFNNFVGHTFITDDCREVTLLSGREFSEKIKIWSPCVPMPFSYYTDDILTIPGGLSGLPYNTFEFNKSTLTYNKTKRKADIEKFGLFTYEELNEIIPMPREVFDAFGGQYLKIAFGKGLSSPERIKYLLARYAKFFEQFK